MQSAGFLHRLLLFLNGAFNCLLRLNNTSLCARLVLWQARWCGTLLTARVIKYIKPLFSPCLVTLLACGSLRSLSMYLPVHSSWFEHCGDSIVWKKYFCISRCVRKKNSTMCTVRFVWDSPGCAFLKWWAGTGCVAILVRTPLIAP